MPVVGSRQRRRKQEKIKLLAATQERTHYAKSNVFTAPLPTFALYVQRRARLNRSPHTQPIVNSVSVKPTGYKSCWASAHTAAYMHERNIIPTSMSKVLFVI